MPRRIRLSATPHNLALFIALVHAPADSLNLQINKEIAASAAYQAMWAYFARDDVGLENIAAFFKQESEDERGHSQKLIDYQLLRGGVVKFTNIEAPIHEFPGKTRSRIAAAAAATIAAAARSWQLAPGTCVLPASCSAHLFPPHRTVPRRPLAAPILGSGVCVVRAGSSAGNHVPQPLLPIPGSHAMYARSHRRGVRRLVVDCCEAQAG